MAKDPGPNPFLRETRSIAVAAVLVAIGFLGSRLLGLLRSVIIADGFGTDAELDAYWVAFRLPDLVFQLLAGATLASAFIPTFASERARAGIDAGWRLASSVLNLLLMGTLGFCLVAFALADQLVPLLAPGLGEEAGQQREMHDLAVDLTRMMLVSPLIFAVSGMFMGILNAQRRFLTPALAPMFYNLAIIVAALFSNDVHALAIGVVVGAALHLLVQLPDLAAAGMIFRLSADWRDAAVRQVASLMAPRVLGLAATQVSFYFVSIFFASRLGEGAISSVSFAWLIVMTPLGVIGMAISTAAFPTLAQQAAHGGNEVGQTLARSLRFILFLSLPTGVALVLLARPIVTVLFQRGAFEVESARLTAQALEFYGAALFAHSAIEILSRGFYAMGDTRTPVLLALGSMLVNVLLAWLLTDLWGVRGLGLALSLATVAEFALLWRLLSRRMLGLAGRALTDAMTRMLVATFAATLVLAGSRVLLERVAGFDVEVWLDSLAVLSLAGLAGGAAYMVASLSLQCEEAKAIISHARSKLPLGRAATG